MRYLVEVLTIEKNHARVIVDANNTDEVIAKISNVTDFICCHIFETFKMGDLDVCGTKSIFYENKK